MDTEKLVSQRYEVEGESVVREIECKQNSFQD
jgi:hypothetical protein